jgi:hypothetical protein
MLNDALFKSLNGFIVEYKIWQFVLIVKQM